MFRRAQEDPGSFAGTDAEDVHSLVEGELVKAVGDLAKRRANINGMDTRSDGVASVKAEAPLGEMRSRLIAWLRRDGYEAPLAGAGWKVFPPKQVARDPDAGLLYQEGAPVADCFPEGYRPRCNP